MSAPHDDLVKKIRIFISEIGGMSEHIETPGLLFDRHHRPVKFGGKGRLDIAATVKGRAVWIDAKIGRDRLKPHQAKWAASQERAGGIAFAAWSVDDVRARLVAEGLL